MLDIQEKINKTDYWDLLIQKFDIKYFGDEIELIFEKDEQYNWKITFVSCLKVNYHTDADWRCIENVKDMKKSQLGYFAHDVHVSKSIEYEGFYLVYLNLTILEANIVCKEIQISKVPVL